MRTTAIICEMNPLHRGHAYILREIRKTSDCVIAVMSGNFVQRGMPAIMDKSLRAKAAILCGADLVLELPVTCALSSAEGFAAGGVEILGNFCDYLCFGSESGDTKSLTATAQALLSDYFPPLLRKYLETGMSFPAARQAALYKIPGVAVSLDKDYYSQWDDFLYEPLAEFVCKNIEKLRLYAGILESCGV